MKKIFTYAATLIAMATNAQSIEVTHLYSGQIVNNNANMYLDSYVDSTVYHELNFKNIGAASTTVSVRRTIDMLHAVGTETAETYFCTGLDCYTPDVFSANITLTPNESISFKQYLREISSKGESSVSYRLQSSATDITFTFKYNNTLGMAENSSANLRSVVIPNPTAGQAVLSLAATKETNAVINIVDLQGAVVWKKADVSLTAGTNLLALPTENLTGGVYFVRISTAEFQGTEKLIIVK